tara:strand:+ start:465 stop:944 length:480 start_codon:yes stop_codon:yes gene_type:complete
VNRKVASGRQLIKISQRVLFELARFPAMRVLGKKVPETIEPAATKHPSPITDPGRMTELAPTKTLFPIEIGLTISSDEVTTELPLGIEACAMTTERGPNIELDPMDIFSGNLLSIRTSRAKYTLKGFFILTPLTQWKKLAAIGRYQQEVARLPKNPEAS